MRVVVMGGTRFIGRRIVTELVNRGDEVVVVHRGETEPDDLPQCRHIHVPRAEYATIAAEIIAYRPDAVIDTLAMTRADTEAVLPHLPDTRIVLLSSMDVYQAFGLVLRDEEGEPLPLNEASPVRRERYPYAASGMRAADYDKLDVEPSYVERGGTVLRLAMIYGEHDRQRREEFMLRRVRAGRTRIPIGAGSWLWTRCYVGDVASAVLATLDTEHAMGEIINIGEPAVRSVRGWARQILAAAGSDAELVRVADDAVPEDLSITRTVDQHIVFDGYKAAQVLGWRPSDVNESIARSVAWHLAHPPEDPDTDFSGDDAALATING